MGEIKRQGISNTVYMYVGLGVGFLNTLFVQPELLTTSEIGLTKVLFSFSMLFSTLLPMGANNIILRYYPRFKDEGSGDHGFLGLVCGITLVGFVVYGLLLWLFSPLFLSSYLEKSPAFASYFFWIFPFGLCLALITILNTYCNGNFRSSFPTFLNDVMVRISLIGLILLYHWNVISWDTYIGLFVASFVLQLLLVLLYIRSFTKLNLRYDWSFLGKEGNREMLVYGLIFLLSSVASMGLKTLDVIILAQFLPLSAVGVYGLAALFPLVIETPLNSLEKIAGPKLTEAMSKGNQKDLSVIYKESAHHLLVIGGWLFLMVVLNIRDFLNLLPVEFQSAYGLVYILATGNLVNMATGVNNPLVYYSDHYKIGITLLLSTLVLAVLNYYLFIPRFGLEGAAIATVLSNLVMNLAKTLIIWWKFQINPFDLKTLGIIGLIGLCSITIQWQLPYSPIVNMSLRVLTISFVYLIGLLVGKFSPNNPVVKFVSGKTL